MAKPRNLLFLLSDNHNRDLLGCYGDAVVRTPNLDRVAAGGARFRNAYSASPLCCPARAALATGRFAHQTGYWDNALVYDGRVPSWMHRMRDAGFETVSVGKLHFRSSDDDNGFAEELIPMHVLDGRGAVQNLLRGYDAELDGRDAGRWQMYLEKSGQGETHYQEYDRNITAHATRWLQARAGKSRWALFVSYVSPHPPFIVPQRLWDLYPEERIVLPPHVGPGRHTDHPSATYHRVKFGSPRRKDIAALRNMIRAYYGLITHLDEQIGTVLGCLEKSGLSDDTLIVYSSDHGEMRGAHDLLGKGLLYEDAVAVPLLFAGAGIPEGAVVDEVVSHTDLYPTFLDAFEVPGQAADSDLRGASLLPALKGIERARTGFAEYHANFSRSAGFMVRDRNMKLIHYEGMPPQLFDLAQDPIEQNDFSRSDAHRDVLAGLQARLREVCDPSEVDRRAKAAQRLRGEAFGGMEALAKSRTIAFSPPPGVDGEAIGAFGSGGSVQDS